MDAFRDSDLRVQPLGAGNYQDRRDGYNRPFDPDQTNTGRSHDILTAGTDLILRW